MLSWIKQKCHQQIHAGLYRSPSSYSKPHINSTFFKNYSYSTLSLDEFKQNITYRLLELKSFVSGGVRAPSNFKPHKLSNTQSQQSVRAISASFCSPSLIHSRSFATSTFGKSFIKVFPKKSTRNAMGVMGFLVVVVVSMDWLTTYQLKNSPYFQYSFKAVAQHEQVQNLLGTPIQLPWRVSVKKQKRRFQLTYTLKGKNGTWAQVIAASTIDPRRGVINDEAFRYIVVQPTTLRKVCFGVLTDGIYDLGAIIGAESWFNETEEERQKRRMTEILVVDRVDQSNTSTTI